MKPALFELMLRQTPAVLVAVALAGCADSTGLHASVVPLTPAADALSATVGVQTNGAWPTPDWVQQFGDPQLNELVGETLQNNPDMQIAKARIGVAQSQLEQFASLVGLTGTAGTTVTKARLPQPSNVANVQVGGRTVPVQLFGDPTASPSALFAGLSYQLDLWGKNAALTRGLVSERNAARVDAEQARLSLTVALVTLYVELDRAFALQDNFREKQHASDYVNDVSRERFARGLDNAYDAADAVLKQNRLLAQMELNDERIELTQLQLGVLTGKGAERGLSIRRPQLADVDNAALPARLPVDLLGRRPDIVAARLHAEAAVANVDATRAQFYPDVNLVAFAGLTGLTPASLFTRGAMTGSVGPAISLPVFDRSRLRAKLGGDFASVDAAVSQYNKTIEVALGEVAQRLTSLRTADKLAVQQAQAVDATTRIVAIANERHQRGLVMQKDVMLADLSLLDERALQIDLQTQRRALEVALIGALGGGFDEQKLAGPPISHFQTAFPSHGRITDTHFD
jgi:NodT family efflux transporter outer membrane factor (OMF) lipoprotein